jgi:3-methylcrotonyl-CoA carboxylase alpha subunit
MPGLVKLVHIRQGDLVSKGQRLLVLEAMKMEHTITAPVDGVIASIVGQGEQVEDRTVLVTFEDEGPA